MLLMKQTLKLLTKTKMASRNKMQASCDPKVEGSTPVEEEEEEEELVDPMDGIKSNCQEAKECEKTREIFNTCTERVKNAPPPKGDEDQETCEEELFDFLHCVDHCLSQSLFSKLK